MLKHVPRPTQKDSSVPQASSDYPQLCALLHTRH